MRTKFPLTNILLALALPLAATGARADSETGPANITIGSTAVSGTAGLLYGDGTHVQSLPGSVTIGAGITTGAGRVISASEYGNLIGTTLALNNNVGISILKDSGGNKVGSANLTLINGDTGGGWGNALEVYSTDGSGHLSLNTYINAAGIFFSSLNLLVSGHISNGAGTGGHYGGGFAVLPPDTYYQNMIAAWSDIGAGGAAFQCRNNQGNGDLCLAAQDHTGLFTIGIDPEKKQLFFGAQTMTASGQAFVGDTFIGRAAAANIRIGGADAASPVAQTISFQNVLAGTSNTAGVNTTFKASAGTGSAAGGSFIFQTALAGSSGTAQNGFTNALTIDGVNGTTLGSIGNTNSAQLTFTPNSGNAVGLGVQASGSLLLMYNSTGGQQFGMWGSGALVASGGCYSFVNNGSNLTGGGSIGLCMVSTSVLNLTAGYSGATAASLAVTSIITPPLTYSTLPSSPTAGQRTYITDANTTTPYATVSSGGGSSKISVLYNGSNWVVD